MILPHRENNFDFIRIGAAYLVLFSHCWPLFGREPEFLSALLNYETGGGLAVSIFFFTSGYLMCGSLLRRDDLFHFVMSRSLRILPGLAVAVLFCVFVVGPAYTDLSLRGYFGQPATWLYLNNIVIFPIRFPLPGVFMHNPAQASVNGSLWTLPIEVVCYILLFIFFRLRYLEGRWAIFVAVAFIAASMIGNTFWHLSWTDRGPNILPSVPLFNFLSYGAFFFTGSAYQTFRENMPPRADLALCALLLFAASAKSAAGPLVESITLPYLVYFCAYSRIPLWRVTQFTGDISYGIYIFAFPIQQAVYATTSSFLGFWPMMALSFTLTTIFGILSWRLFEKPALELKWRLDDLVRSHPVTAVLRRGWYNRFQRQKRLARVRSQIKFDPKKQGTTA